MLSRATRRRRARHRHLHPPGSENAVRLAMTKLILPELGHVVGSCGDDASRMRPIRETISARRSAGARSSTRRRPIERTRRVPLATRRTRDRGAAGRVDGRAAVRSRRMDGYAVRAEDTFGAGRYDPKLLRVIDKVYTGQVPSKTVAAGECVEIATARRCRRGPTPS
jgi:hypothetical protein